jgi:hypothetical protein
MEEKISKGSIVIMYQTSRNHHMEAYRTRAHPLCVRFGGLKYNRVSILLFFHLDTGMKLLMTLPFLILVCQGKDKLSSIGDKQGCGFFLNNVASAAMMAETFAMMLLASNGGVGKGGMGGWAF